MKSILSALENDKYQKLNWIEFIEFKALNSYEFIKQETLNSLKHFFYII